MGSRRSLFSRLLPGEVRPPGALPEDQFLARCIQCGRCGASCPYQSIRSAGFRSGLAVGTPIVRPRDVPCYICMICPGVCPTGALVPLAKEAVDMGEAIVDEASCFAFQGILCRACVDACPFQGTAIRQDLKLRPIVDPKACVGCGLCVKVCPAEPEAIRVS